MKKNVFLGLGLSVVLASCGFKSDNKKEIESNQTIVVNFSGSEKFDIKNSDLKIGLFAISKNIADAPATLIVEKNIKKTEIPFEVDLELPANHIGLIKPEVKENEPIKYYVTVAWDSDGNGVIEKGDIGIDFDKKFPYVELSDEVQEVYLKNIK